MLEVLGSGGPISERILREFVLEISWFLVALSLIVFACSILAGWHYDPKHPEKDNTPFWLEWLVEPLYETNAWLWTILISVIVLLFGLWYGIENIRFRLEFNRLIDTESKKKFLENLDRLEYLAWKLSRAHERKVLKKKAQFRIR